MRFEPDEECRKPLLEHVRLMAELQPAAPLDRIQTAIAQRIRPASAHVGQTLATPCASHATDLEDISEVAVESQCQRHRQRMAGVTGDAKAIKAAAFTQHAGARDVNFAMRERDVLAIVDIRIGQVGDKEGVVVGDGRTEEQRPRLVEKQLPTGEKTRTAGIQPSLGGKDIAALVEHGEGVSGFEHAERGDYSLGRRDDRVLFLDRCVLVHTDRRTDCGVSNRYCQSCSLFVSNRTPLRRAGKDHRQW